MPGEQFPSVGTIESEEVRVIVATAPLKERIVGRLGGDCVVDCFRAQLSQMGEAAGPTERELPAVRIRPVVPAIAGAEEVSLGPIHVVAVGIHKTHRAARVVEVDRSRVEVLGL